MHSVHAPALHGVVGNITELEWQVLVESIAIDPAYDGQVFRAMVADAPLGKRSAVTGRYLVTAPSLPTTVAVRIVDIAGSEQLVTCLIDK